MIEFDYRQERLRTGEIIFRPVAKIYLLRSESEWIAQYFYIDSGADYTLIPYRMGRFLGLERIASEVKEMGGIGGVIAVRFAVVPIKIEAHRFDCTIAWAQIEQVPFLLGREKAFEYFEITFKQKARKVIFIWQGEKL
ncbi:MAG: hypothetical protein COS84_08555 [Armatimonadetes bacterium CG07_land_8_20_14_0_80_40_9]|nr:MAG: hypothetical protein COS84_08555 [Armatimonadetes bacterium CG07_land_8_20_14_0_80_40_9]